MLAFCENVSREHQKALVMMICFPSGVDSLSSVVEHLQWCSICDLSKIILTSKFSYLIFPNFTHKTKTGTANMWETTNNKLPGSIIMIGQSETGSSSQITFITLFSNRYTALLCLLLVSANCAKMLGENHFAKPNLYVLTFLHPILICRVTYQALVELL